MKFRSKTSQIVLAVFLCLCFQNQVSGADKLIKPNEPGPWPSIQVNTYTGNLFYERSDLFIPTRGEIPLEISFSYNSLKHLKDCGYGNGWSFSFGWHYSYVEDDFTVFREEGQEDVFTWDGSGFVPPVGVYDALTEYESGKYLLRTKYGIKYYFENDSHFQLTKIEDRNGNATILSYSGGKPTTITDPSGRTLNLSWVGNHLAQITDPNTSPSRVIAFQYDGSWNLIQVIRPMTSTWQYVYDVNGNMVSVTDPRYNTVTISYDVNEAVAGLSCLAVNYNKTFAYNNCNNTTTVSQVVSSINRQTVYTFDLAGRVTSKQFPDGNAVSYTWDSQYNMITFINETGGSTSYAYDAKANMLSKTDCLGNAEFYSYESTFNQMTSFQDKNGNLTTYGYDASGNLTGITDCFNNQEIFTNDSFGNRITAKDKNNKTTSFTYNIYGNRTGLTDPLFYSETRTFDQVGNMLTSIDKRGFTTTYAYDLLDRNTLITDAMGYTRSFTYDANSNLTGETNQNGKTTTYFYDAANRIVMVTDATGNNSSRVYDEAGNMTAETNANGFTTAYTFNSRDWRTLVTDCNGNSQSYTYNAAGFMLTATDKGGNTTNYTTDCLGQTTLLTDPNGFTESFIFDAAGNNISFTNKNGITTTSNFDCLNRLFAINYPLGYTELFAYDAEDNQTGFTDKNGNITTYAFDALNRMVLKTDPLGKTESGTFDGEGNVTSLTNKNGNTTTFTYDPLGRLTVKTDPLPFSYTESFTYDGVGNMLTSKDRRGNTTSRGYDNLNRQTSMTTPMGYTETTTYDAMGNVTASTNKNGFTTTFNFDCLGQKTSIIDPMSFMDSYTYNANGNMTGHTGKNWATTTWNYSCCRLLSTTDPLLFTEYYGYDNAGNRTSVTNNSGKITTYAFDFLDRLTGITTPLGNQTLFTLDGNGNALSRTDPNLNITNYTYNARGELINTLYPDATSITYTYNNNGDLLQTVNTGGIGETITYTFDVLGRVTSKATNFGTFTKTITYTYDQNGNNLTVTTQTGTISYQYDNDNRVTQITDQNGGVTTFQYDGMGHQTVVNYPNGVSTFTTYDANGNVLSVVTQTTPPPPASNPGRKIEKDKGEIPAEIISGTDYAIVEILAPVSGPGLGEAEPVIVTVMNFGTVVLEGISLSYTLDDIGYTEYVPVIIPPMGAYDHLFSQPADLSEPGHTYELTACVMATGDMDPSNDCMTTLITNMIVITTYQAFYYECNPDGTKSWEGHLDGSSIAFEYSLRNELLSEYALPSGNFNQYAYTPTRQRESITVNGISTLYFYNDDDVLIYTGEEAFTIDDNGNRIEATDPIGNYTAYTYGFENELIDVATPLGTGSQYHYSALGTQLAENENGIMTYFHSSGGEVLEEFNAAGVPVCYYNPGVSVSHGGLTGYNYYDRSGSATLQLDPAQSVLATASFDEFGTLTGSTGSWLNNKMLFRTEDHESNINLINLDNGLFYDFSTNALLSNSSFVSGEHAYIYSWFWRIPLTETLEEYLSGITRSGVAALLTTVQHCCCCINDLRTPLNVTKTNIPGGAFYIKFDTEIDLEYKLWDQNYNGDCTLEWWEKTSMPYTRAMKADTWTDMTQDPQTSASFNHSWNCRDNKCPPPHKTTVKDTDDGPGWPKGFPANLTATYVLYFKITVKSTPGCDCLTTARSRFITVTHEIKDGKPGKQDLKLGVPKNKI
jgi:YD repeat-containing protein